MTTPSSPSSPFDYRQSQAFLRDKFVPFADATLSIASSPVLYGLSIYTVFGFNWNTAAANGAGTADVPGRGYIFRLRDHYARLVASAHIMDFNTFAAAWPYERFEATMFDLIRRNALRENALIRATVFVDALIAGTNTHDLPHALTAYAYPMGDIYQLGQGGRGQGGGIRVCVSSWTRTSDNAIPSRAKVNGSYANATLMKNEAIQNGYDDAIALDAQGHVTESTVANLFLVRGGVLITPASSADILEGITRNSILRIARDSGIPVVERTVDRSELYIADEIFVCGSSARVTPVLEVDRRTIGAGALGPITAAISKKYSDIQNGEGSEIYKDWVMEV